MRILQGIALAAFVIFLALCIWIAWDVHRATRQLPALATDVDRSVLILAGAGTNLEKTLRAERDASAAQLAASAEAQRKLNLVLDSTRITIGQANHVLADLDSAIQMQDHNLSVVEQQATAAIATLELQMQQLDPAIKSANVALANTARLSADPALHETLLHVDATTAAMQATGELVQDSMKDIHDFIHRETAPVRGAWNTIKAFLREFAGPAAQVAVAAKP